jgi:mannose-1-phosphate guanylyltransferase / phosphomannomutase
MKSVIIAGGKGSRTGGLSQNEPKHILPVLNKPLIDYHIDNLSNHYPIRFAYSPNNKSFFDVYLTNRFPNLLDNGSLRPHNDTVLKGPLYPLFELLHDYKEEKQDILALTGDMFCNINIEEVIKFHKEQNWPMTLVATRTYPSPKACSFNVGGNGLLKGFRRLEGISGDKDLINLGLYVANTDLLNIINLDLESYKEDVIFKKLIEEKALGVYVLEDNAVNINTPYNLLCANLSQLDSNVFYGNNCNFLKKSNMTNVVVGNNTTIKEHCTLRNVVIMDDCIVESNSQLENVIIAKGTKVSADTNLNNSIIYPNQLIEDMEIFYDF